MNNIVYALLCASAICTVVPNRGILGGTPGNITDRIRNLGFVGRWAPAWGVAFASAAFMIDTYVTDTVLEGNEPLALFLLAINGVLLVYVVLRTLIPRWHFLDNR